MYGFIYITTNLVNGKKYLGQCRYGKKGWESYLGSGKALKRAVKKYGKENFSREVIEECETPEDLIEKENHYLDLYDAQMNENFYNIQGRAYATKGFSGKTHSDSYKRKMSALYKGKKRPPEVTEKMRASLTGRKVPVEERRKVSVAAKKMWANPNSKLAQKVKCPHCDKEGRGGVMKRYHFDACKFKE